MRRPRRLHLERQRDRLLRVVGGSARYDGNAPRRLFDRYLDDPPVLRDCHRCGLTGRSTRDYEVNAARDLPLDKGAQRALVDLA